MDGNSWRQAAPAPAPPDPAGAGVGADPAGGDWRQQLSPEARQRIVNKIMDTLKRHFPIRMPEGLGELKKIAVRFEEKIYTAATNQSDYLRQISVKMLSTPAAAAINPSLSNPVVGNQSPSESVPTMNMQPQSNQAQSLAIPMVSPSQVRQPVLPSSLQNNNVSAALQGFAGLSSALPPIVELNQSSLANARQNLSQNTSNNSAGQGIAQNLYANQQQQQYLGSQSGGMHSQQRPMHNLQQSMTVAQQQHQQPMSSLQSQGQLSQNQAPQQLMPQIQAQGPQLQQQLTMQQKIQREMQQRLQASAPMDSTTQIGHGGMGDWQEEIYQKVNWLTLTE